ncbi:magnesium chelatase subunit D [Rhodopseudomonas palustris]|uniref:Mg-protoporphyrin IX chelatase n=1 Tax=Rhodopseudomonas palustris (strain ATCC BAA-98 / CGA009) TaxID=258594 RepID=Q6N9N3_RHOPA|nr:magnesium chelatase subunit D [Rhodopseudomonas palustris]OPF91266.1 magnesium chelatase ATPase subunit D [Rhodopseudomonas palustris]PPQ43906.1 magnesium chelatase ATPase subunit D [Rhodopseudomonas palustris]QQM03007.1 Magnesium-chelatase 60 kDa subunit [Rhodopseudomonas palustris]RJF60573.1 magnesium chelatase subunit D [Rhodopseudomonas palustris]WAB79178.1 magnesium chelatase subunit D [Rhodopseudomonas palustris]
MSIALAWSDAVTAAQLFAVDPVGTGGVLLRSRAGPVRDRWLAMMRAALPPEQPYKHLPLHIADGRLLGGLDLSATLLAGRPVAERGLLSEADGGVMVVAMAERLQSSTNVYLTAAMDAHETAVERDGLSLRMPARFGVVALDEGLEDEFSPAGLRDRLGFHLDLDQFAWRETDDFPISLDDIRAARARLADIKVESEQIEAVCTAAAALGIISLRAPLLAIRAAKASAALFDRTKIEQDDITLAARLVLAPRATIFPQQEQPDQADEPPPPEPPPPEDDNQDNNDQEQQTPDIDKALDEVILAAVKAAMPPGVLEAMRASAGRARARSAGKAGELQKSKKRGRPAGSIRGELRDGSKLNVIETLRAAAPWQPLRRRQAEGRNGSAPRILVEKDDFRIARFKQRTETITIFVVDASGSAALHRLAEAKGAVELLLADCYVRRDQVAMISFRGTIAEILLPPTRSLARAKRSLAGLPGGGGTPLSAGLDCAFMLADSIKRKGQTPTVIVLTDGRANIARDGAPGRPQAEEDAKSSARQFRVAGISSVVIDMSPRPGPQAEAFAKEMDARYLPMPHADATVLAQAVTAATRQD